MISFIIPAHNEEYHLSLTLTAIQNVIAELRLDAEVIVVNDDSTDRTEQVANEMDVNVINVHYRHIAATRNAGGRAAQGDYLFFVDADTQVNENSVAEALNAMQTDSLAVAALFILMKQFRGTPI